MNKVSIFIRLILVSQLMVLAIAINTVVLPSTASALRISNSTPSPVIVYPQNNAVLTNFPRTAFLRWSPIKTATSYIVEIECDTRGNTPWTKVGTYYSWMPSFTTPGLPGDNRFRFRVRALEKNSIQRPWSNYTYFRYTTKSQPASLPDLVITNIFLRNDIVNNVTRKPRWFVEIKNIGTACASNFKIKLQGSTKKNMVYQGVLPTDSVSSEAGLVSPTWKGSLCPSDLPGRGVNFEFNQNVDPIISVRGTIDSTNVVLESQEGNNIKTQNLLRYSN